MRVEVLYVPDCPFHPAAVKLVRDVLAAEGVAADVREILVEDERMASKLKFAGSPTIRVNGREVAGAAQTPESFALCCRVYPGSEQIGLPPVELVRHAVLEAHHREQR